MSGDTLVYDMASMTEGSPNIFVKKDWLNILDNQNGNYQGNQCVVDTSQLANSNKYMNYREAYLAVPMVLTATNGTANEAVPLVAPATAATSADMTFGLKNWFGSIVHSLTLDYNGTTICQQTPYLGIWNCFRLLTTLSYQDLVVNGAEMGFYPDDPLSFGFASATTGANAASASGVGTYNNVNRMTHPVVDGRNFGFKDGNEGFLRRQMYIAYDPDAITGGAAAATSATYSSLFNAAACVAQYKSYISSKVNSGAGVFARIQYSIMATIRLKHLHNFFQNVPLLKGVFMKMTLNLNQTSVRIITPAANNADTYQGVSVSVNSPLGGVSPIMIASAATNSGGAAAIDLNSASKTLIVSLAVGNRPIIPEHSTFTTSFPTSIQLYVPAYTFNPVYETAYLSNPVKKIVYTDIYQYQVLNVAGGTTFNNLLTNGIANIKSVLIVPFFATGTGGTGAGGNGTGNEGISPILSPFTGEGSGTTSPLSLLTNFNVVVAGQNQIYNTQRYSYEQFLHQLQGANAINADMTDGLTSGLIDKIGFEHQYCYYYVNCSRMLPVEESVPKSVSIIGQNSSLKAVDLYCFIEYGVEVSIDVLTGARV